MTDLHGLLVFIVLGVAHPWAKNGLIGKTQKDQTTHDQTRMKRNQSSLGFYRKCFQKNGLVRGSLGARKEAMKDFKERFVHFVVVVRGLANPQLPPPFKK